MPEDLGHNSGFEDEGEDPQLGAAPAGQWIHLIDPPDHLRPGTAQPATLGSGGQGRLRRARLLVRFGRTGIFEVLPITDAIKQLILQGADAPKIKREAVNQGMRTLRQSALRKLAEGATTYEEVIRVTSI